MRESHHVIDAETILNGPRTLTLEAFQATAGIDSDAGILAALDSEEFDFDNPPEQLPPILEWNESGVMTAGGLCAVQGPPKGGKSAVIAAILAAFMNGRRQGPDTLAFDAENPDGRPILHFDTEQSRFDHDALVRRSMKRAWVSAPPPWLRSYSVLRLTIPQRLAAIEAAMRRAGNPLAVVIDGIADFCIDPNDAGESFALVHRLMRLADEYQCGVVAVLHENPGTESGKTRGHLGSELTRKAESNIRIKKDADGVSTIWNPTARHKETTEADGICFVWSEEHLMHTQCGNSGERKADARRGKSESEAFQVFLGKESLSYSALVDHIIDALAIEKPTAKVRITNWKKWKIIQKNADGSYQLAQ